MGEKAVCAGIVEAVLPIGPVGAGSNPPPNFSEVCGTSFRFLTGARPSCRAPLSRVRACGRTAPIRRAVFRWLVRSCRRRNAALRCFFRRRALVPVLLLLLVAAFAPRAGHGQDTPPPVTTSKSDPVLYISQPAAATEGSTELHAAIHVNVFSDREISGTLSVRLRFAAKGSSTFDADDIQGELTQTLQTTGFSELPDGEEYRASVSIPVVDDTKVEGAEIYTVELLAGAGYRLSTLTHKAVKVEGVINDDDKGPTLRLGDPPRSTEGTGIDIAVPLTSWYGELKLSVFWSRRFSLGL